MISATIVNANTGTAEASTGQPGSLTQAGAAECAADFLTQLQAAMGVPTSLPEESESVSSEELDAPETEMAELVGLQNLPTVGVPIAGAAANFAVPLDTPIQTVAGDPLLAAQQNSILGVLGDVTVKPEHVPSDQVAVTQALKVSAELESPHFSPVAEQAVQSAGPVFALDQDVPETDGASVAQDQDASETDRPSVALPTSLPEPALNSVRRLSEPVVGATNPMPAVVGQALATEPITQAAVSLGNKPINTVGGMQQVQGDSSLLDLKHQVLTPMPVVHAVTAVDGVTPDDGLTADKPIVANATGAMAINAGNFQDAPDLGMANGGGTQPQQSSTASVANSPILEASHRMPLEPHQMRLDGGPVQVEVLKLVRQGGGQIVMELTPPDQGAYRLDLRLDSQGRAHLFVEGASDSVRTRLEQSEAVLREQLSQMGLDLQLNYRQESRSFADANDASGPDQAQQMANDRQGSADFASEQRTRAPIERGLVHLYA